MVVDTGEVDDSAGLDVGNLVCLARVDLDGHDDDWTSGGGHKER